jgi:hypothetical protein
MSIYQVTAESACTKSLGAAVRCIWEKNIGECGGKHALHAPNLSLCYHNQSIWSCFMEWARFLLIFVSLSTLMILSFLFSQAFTSRMY